MVWHSRCGDYPIVDIKHKLDTDKGVTQEIWDTQFQKQGCACAICGTYESGSKDWHTDHNHTTNTFRGVLCHHCNLLLGHAKDDVWILEQAITYLKETP